MSNQIAVIDKAAFQGLSSLITLDLSWNKISVLPAGVFGNLSQWKNISLAFNFLSAVSDEILEGMTSLNFLELDQNLVSVAQSGTFKSLNYLKQLHLGHNKLSALKNQMFSGITKIRNLSLHNNQISIVEHGSFDELSVLTDLHLSFNHLLSIKTTTEFLSLKWVLWLAFLPCHTWILPLISSSSSLLGHLLASVSWELLNSTWMIFPVLKMKYLSLYLLAVQLICVATGR